MTSTPHRAFLLLVAGFEQNNDYAMYNILTPKANYSLHNEGSFQAV